MEKLILADRFSGCAVKRTIAACLRRFSLPAGMGLGEFQISGPLGVSAGCNAYSQSLLRTWVELRTTGK